jgi:hypothetical protein
MKFLSVLTAVSLLALSTAGAAEPPDNARQLSEQQILALVKEVQAQQALIADNQARIDAKLVTIAEAVRVARIYSSRGGR